MTEQELHSDTSAWLGERSGFRQSIAGAFLAGGQAPAEEEEGEEEAEEAEEAQEEQAQEEEPSPGNQQASIFSCEVSHNDAFESVETNPFQSEVEGGFPDSTAITKDVIDGVKDFKTAEELIPLQRQINALESFRKTTLNRKQRRVHLIRHSQENWSREGQYQSELQDALIGRQIGLSGNIEASDEE